MGTVLAATPGGAVRVGLHVAVSVCRPHLLLPQSYERHSSLRPGPTGRPRVTPRLGVSNLIPSAATFVHVGTHSQAFGRGHTVSGAGDQPHSSDEPCARPVWILTDVFAMGSVGLLASNSRDLGITAVDHLYLSDEPFEGPQSS